MNRDELRRFALAVKAQHAAAWVFPGDERVPICDFCAGNFPCDAYELAEAVLELLDEGDDEQLSFGRNMADVKRDVDALLDEAPHVNVTPAAEMKRIIDGVRGRTEP